MSEHAPITKRQQRVLDFIRKYIAKNGYPPVIRDICKGLRISSPNGIICHLKALQKKGVLVRKPYKSRTLRIVEAVK